MRQEAIGEASSILQKLLEKMDMHIDAALIAQAAIVECMEDLLTNVERQMEKQKKERLDALRAEEAKILAELGEMEKQQLESKQVSMLTHEELRIEEARLMA